MVRGMRVLAAVLLAGCSGTVPCDAGRASPGDAGRDAGAPDAGPSCVVDAGERLAFLYWMSDTATLACLRNTCSRREYAFGAVMCRWKAVYTDAGCSVVDDGGEVLIDCMGLCNSDAGRRPCCERLPPGAHPESCGVDLP